MRKNVPSTTPILRETSVTDSPASCCLMAETIYSTEQRFDFMISLRVVITMPNFIEVVGLSIGDWSNLQIVLKF